MNSITVKINPPSRNEEFRPYFVTDSIERVWLVVAKKSDGRAEAIFVTGSTDYKPFQLKTEIREKDYKVMNRCRLGFMIGDK